MHNDGELPATPTDLDPSPKPSFKPTPKRAALSGWVGSTLEYYDFFIYAQAAALVFPILFFPKGSSSVAIIAALATYGAGYVMRPIGGAVLGHLSDTLGRKRILLASMIIIGLSTTMIGLLPTYASIGWIAPLLLVVLRLIQGFAVGGELACASTVIVEHTPDGKRGFYGSFATQGVNAGQLLAASFFLPLSALMPDDTFLSWGWRIPFLLSVVVLFAGYLIRRQVDETPVFQRGATAGARRRAPLAEVIRNSPVAMARVFLMSTSNVILVLTTVFGATYATSAAYGIGFSISMFLAITVCVNIVAISLNPLLGKLSDLKGRRFNSAFGILGSSIAAVFFLYFISIGNQVLTLISAVISAGVLYSFHNSSYPAFYQEMFPTRTRVTGFALPFNLGNALSAFMASLFATFAPPGANVPLIVGSIVLGMGVIGAIAAWTAPETYRISLTDENNQSRPSSRASGSAQIVPHP